MIQKWVKVEILGTFLSFLGSRLPALVASYSYPVYRMPYRCMILAFDGFEVRLVE